MVARIREAVLARYEAEQRHGRNLSGEDERQLFRSLIARELEEESRRRIERGAAQLSREAERALGRAVENAIFGLGRLQSLLEIRGVEDIHIVGTAPPLLRMNDGSVCEADVVVAASDDDLLAQLMFIAAHHGSSERAFSPAQPFLNMQLPDGSRLAAVRDVVPHPTVTVRRHHFVDVGLGDLVPLGTLSEQMRRFHAALVRARRTVLITGMPSAGKTTLLRAFADEIGSAERVATLETEFELGLHRLRDRYPLLMPMECRPGSTELDPATGRRAGEITLSDLLWQALRMSPERVLVGEVRGEEALPMLEAMHTGMPGACTLHAHSSPDAFERLVTAALKAGGGLSDRFVTRLAAKAINYVVHLRHIDQTAFGGPRVRFVSEISEVTGVNEQGVVSMNRIFGPGPGEPRGVVQTMPQIREPFEEAGLDLEFLHDDSLGWRAPLNLGRWAA